MKAVFAVLTALTVCALSSSVKAEELSYRNMAVEMMGMKDTYIRGTFVNATKVDMSNPTIKVEILKDGQVVDTRTIGLDKLAAGEAFRYVDKVVSGANGYRVIHEQVITIGESVATTLKR